MKAHVHIVPVKYSLNGYAKGWLVVKNDTFVMLRIVIWFYFNMVVVVTKSYFSQWTSVTLLELFEATWIISPIVFFAHSLSQLFYV